MTDDNWQHSFTNRQSKYADGVLYHSKAGYIMIGNPDRFMPLSLELGLEMATQFGGTSHMFDAAGKETVVKNNGGLKGMFKALIPGGGDAPEMSTIYQNAEGNHLGSWVARLNYDADTWKFSFCTFHLTANIIHFLLDATNSQNCLLLRIPLSLQFLLMSLQAFLFLANASQLFLTGCISFLLESLLLNFQLKNLTAHLI